ncbi:MAG: hypothetical protein WCV50_02730 [Patescibacteria group bacterium]|jgi:predicted Zn-dependent protease
MKKLLTIGLSIFVILLFIFIIFRYSANASNTDNWFNNNVRVKLARYPYLRTAFNLRWDGDGKTDYLLNGKYEKLLIEIDNSDLCTVPDSVIEEIKAQIQDVIEKPLGIAVDDSQTIPLTQDSYTAEDIRRVSDAHQSRKTRGDTAVFYILCLNRFADDSSNIGVTVYENGMAVFSQRLADLVGNNPAAMDAYYTSTILHEFGHQLGVDHVDNIRCIMDASIETPSDRVAQTLIPKNYCQEELQLFENIRSSL